MCGVGKRYGPGGARALGVAACTGRACAERTSNMPLMSVTLDVSKLSSWLKANAYCRVEKEGHATRGEVRGQEDGGAKDVARRRAHAPRTRKTHECEGLGGKVYARRVHPEHASHVRDAGRVEAQQLVERHRSLPSCKEGTRNGARCGPGGERAVGAVVVQATCREGLDRWMFGAIARTANM